MSIESKVSHCILIGLAYLLTASIAAQNISTFTSVQATPQTQGLVLPSTHHFQVLAQTGDTLSDGSILKTAPDFTAFVPINGQNDSAYLSLNHEIGGLQGGVTVFELDLDTAQQLWNLSRGAAIDFAAAGGINQPCSGGISPWGTVISGEEAILTSDLDSNQYYDSGWLVETNPSQRTFVQKLWKAGNARHENCALASDLQTLYWGADDYSQGYIFKFVATEKMQLAEGALFVLVRDSVMPSLGGWVQVPNETPSQCNTINAFCQQVGAWNFSGIEDVEIGPEGKIYFATKFSGRIWKFKEEGNTVSALEVFVENTSYPIETNAGIQWTPWGIGADNLAFDDQNNLWVLQDGGYNHIWVVHPDHRPAAPKIRIFATTPAGSEPTGITFSPDYRYIFLSLQHPSFTNAAHYEAANGKQVIFNRGTTVVIGRRSFLGPPIVPKDEPLSIPSFELTLAPNPTTSGQVWLSSAAFQTGKKVEIEVFDPIGAICHQQTLILDQNTVYLNFQIKTKGVYTIRVKHEGSVGVGSLMVL